MERNKDNWLDKYAVTCRVFKGRWSIRHCIRIYSEIKDLKIEMAQRARGGVQHYESAYNPCEHCRSFARTLKALRQQGDNRELLVSESGENQTWAACG